MAWQEKMDVRGKTQMRISGNPWKRLHWSLDISEVDGVQDCVWGCWICSMGFTSEACELRASHQIPEIHARFVEDCFSLFQGNDVRVCCLLTLSLP